MFNFKRAFERGKEVQGEGGNIADVSGTYFDEFFKSNKQKKADDLMGFLEQQQQSQADQAAKIKAELDAQGRPIQEDEVNRIQQIVSMAKANADRGLPEQAYQNAVQNIERSTSAGLAGASSRGGALNSIGSIFGNQISAFQNLAAQDAMAQQQNQGTYMNTLQMLAGAEGRAEQYNTLLPYEQKVSEYQTLTGTANQNAFYRQLFGYQDAAQQQQMYMDLVGAGVGAGGQVAGAAIASDMRLKEDIISVGKSPSGIEIMTFRYKGDSKVYQGTTAQHLLSIGRKDAVVETSSGFMAVVYGMLDIEFKQVSHG